MRCGFCDFVDCVAHTPNDDMMTNLLVQAKALNHATITMQTSLIV